MRSNLTRAILAAILALTPLAAAAAPSISPDKVQADIRKLLEEYRGDPRQAAAAAELYLRLAQLYQQRGRIDEAIAANREAARLAPRNYVAAMQLVALFLDQQRYAEALVELDQASHFFATPVQYRLRRAEVLQALGRMDDADAELREASKLAPHSHQVKIEIARLLIARGKNPQAQEYLQQARTDARNSPEAMVEVAVAFRDAGWPDVAEKILEEVVSLRPHDFRSFSNLGELYVGRGDWTRAEKAFARSLELAPYVAETNRRLGDALAQQGKEAEALDRYRQAARQDPDDARAFLTMAGVHRQKGRTAEALAALQQAMAVDPESAVPYRHLGDLHREAGDFALAAAAYQAAIARDPGSAETLAQLGWLKLFTAEFRDSEALLRRALAMKPALGRPRHTLVSALYFQNRVDEALALADKYLEATPDAAELVSLRAYLLYTLDRVSDTYDATQRLFELQPGNLEHAIGMAEMAQEMGEAAKAQALFQRVAARLAAAPAAVLQDPELYLMRARAQAGLAQYNEALENLLKAQQLNKNVLSIVNIHRNLGYVHFLRGEYAQAIATFRAGLKASRAAFEPEFWETRFSLGFALLQAGQPEEAEREMRAYAERFPRNIPAQANLAQALAAAGRDGDAEALLRRALAANPGSPNAHLSLGLLRYRQGRFEDAAAAFRATLAAMPRHLGAHIGLGLCLLEQGNPSQAEWEFSQAIAVDLAQREPLARMGIAFLRQLEDQGEKARRTYDEALALAPQFKDRDYAERYIRLWMPAKGRATGAWKAILGPRTV